MVGWQFFYTPSYLCASYLFPSQVRRYVYSTERDVVQKYRWKQVSRINNCVDVFFLHGAMNMLIIHRSSAAVGRSEEPRYGAATTADEAQMNHNEIPAAVRCPSLQEQHLAHRFFTRCSLFNFLVFASSLSPLSRLLIT